MFDFLDEQTFLSEEVFASVVTPIFIEDLFWIVVLIIYLQKEE
jgi:hypothetical protein